MKTIIICSDGTWQSPESDTGSHVLRIARGISPEDQAGCKQVVFYDWDRMAVVSVRVLRGAASTKIFSIATASWYTTTMLATGSTCSASVAVPIRCARWPG